MYVRAKSAIAATAAAALVLTAWAVPNQTLAASVSSDAPAALIIAPKIQVDDTGALFGAITDTTIQITNTDPTNPRSLHCFYVNATRHCAISGVPCTRSADCVTTPTQVGDYCDNPPWTANNFTLTLTANQTIGWNASTGIVVPNPGTGSVQPVSENPFLGELKCVEMTDESTAALPLNSNDLIGNISIQRRNQAGTVTDARSYNAIGVQSEVDNNGPQNDLVLCLGGTPNSTECPVPTANTTSEYAACPRSLWMNLFFDGAVGGAGPSRTNSLTLVPCSENFVDPDEQVTTTVQFLVYNEFEQRFSTKTTLDCYADTPLAFIDSRINGANSIFTIGIQGTVGGQALIRPVVGSETDAGHGILGIGEQALLTLGSADASRSAFNLNYSGANPQGDIVRFVIP